MGAVEFMNIWLNFEAVAAVDSEQAIAAINDGNGIFKINLQTGESIFAGRFPDEQSDGSRLYCAAAYYAGKIIFIPNSAKNIAIYDLKNNMVETIAVKKVDKKIFPHYKANFKFADYVIYENNIYLISATYPAIIKMNLESLETEYITGWVPNEYFFFRKGKFLEKDSFVVPSSNSNLVLRFDLKNDVAKVYRVGNNTGGYWSIVKEGKSYWLAPKTPGPVIEWEINNNKITEHDNYPENFVRKKFSFTKIYALNSKICITPCDAQMFVELDPKSGKMKDNNLWKLEPGDWVDYLFELNEYLYLRIKDANSKYTYIRINLTNNVCEEFGFFFKGDILEFEKIIFENIRDNVIRENSTIGVREYIHFLLADK